MTTQTKSTTIVFDGPFTLPGISHMLPAGAYCIETDIEQIDGLTWTAHRNVATYIHLPSTQEAALPRQIVEIDQADLEAAVQKDKTPS